MATCARRSPDIFIASYTKLKPFVHEAHNRVATHVKAWSRTADFAQNSEVYWFHLVKNYLYTFRREVDGAEWRLESA